jgi:hypothetical protein
VTTHDSTLCCCRIWLYGVKHAAYGGANVRDVCASPLTGQSGLPLAARGLAAVLARAGPAGGGGRCAQTAPEVAGSIVSYLRVTRQRLLFPAASDALCLTGSWRLPGLDSIAECQEVGAAFSGGGDRRRRQEEVGQAARDAQ